jgi:hypothetical protein
MNVKKDNILVQCSAARYNKPVSTESLPLELTEIFKIEE